MALSLIDFTPGLQSLGNMFENKSKMELDLYERQYQLEKQNKLLKFNNLLSTTFANIQDEEELLEKTNLFTAYANQNNILDEVSNNISLIANSKNKQIQYAKEEKALESIVNEKINSGGYREYEGKILQSSDIINKLKANKVSNKEIINIYDKLNEAKYSYSIAGEGNKAKLVAGLKTDTNFMDLGEYDITDKNGIGYIKSNGIERKLTPDEQEEYNKYRSKAFSQSMQLENLNISYQRLNNDKSIEKEKNLLKNNMEYKASEIARKTRLLKNNLIYDSDNIFVNYFAGDEAGQFNSATLKTLVNNINGIVETTQIKNKKGNNINLKDLVSVLKFYDTSDKEIYRSKLKELMHKNYIYNEDVIDYVEDITSLIYQNEQLKDME